MSLTILIFAAFVGFRAHAVTVEYNDPNLKTVKAKVYFKGRPFSGDVTQHWPTGALYKSTAYTDGVEDGPTQVFAPNKRMIQSWNYHLGKKDGVQRGWFEEGPKRFEYHFKDGILDGAQTEWHLTGGVFRRQVYKDGVETSRKVLYAGGEIFTNYTKRGGRTYGLDGGALCREPDKKDGEK